MQEVNEEKKSIDYFGIIKKSWQITWANKYLWWFGLLVSFGGGINASMPFDGKNIQESYINNQGVYDGLVDFLGEYYQWIIVGLFGLLLIILLVLVLKIFGRIGLIKLIDDIIKGKKTGVKSGLKEGRIYFWKIFLIDILLGIFIVGVVAVLFLPVIYLFYLYLEALSAAFISLFLAVIIFVALLMLTSLLRVYSYIYIVLGKVSVRASVENAYKVFSENISTSVIMLLILLLTAGVFWMVISGVILGLVASLIALAEGLLSTIVVTSLGVAIVMLVYFLARAMWETFIQTVWILWLKEISRINIRESVMEVDEKVMRKKVPDPEIV